MSFTVRLYTLKKRDNSTKQPPDNGWEFNCVLKDGCGILHPTIKLDMGLTDDPSQYNYAYIPKFGRYYFIEEWYFENRLWVASMKVDVLATYKNNIGNSVLYVLRAAGDQDEDIIDTLYPAKAGCTFDSDTKNNPWDDNMCFVIGVVSKNANFGSMCYYAVSGSTLSTLCTELLDSTVTETNGYSWQDCSQALQLSLVDPLQYIKSCVALPVALSDVQGSGAVIGVFNWSTSATGTKLLLNPHISKSYTFDIIKHPDTASRGNYVNSAPFTNISLTIPPFGTFDIDTSVTCNAKKLTANLMIDPITGKASLTIMCKSIVLNRVESQLGVPISLSSVTRDYVGGVSALAGAVSSLASAYLGAGGVLGAINGIGNGVSSLMPRASTIGTTGSFGTLQGDFRLDHQFFRPVADDNTHNGRPLCAMRKLNTLSGYMIIQDGDVTINGTSSEDAAIRAYLEGGFYYE